MRSKLNAPTPDWIAAVIFAGLLLAWQPSAAQDQASRLSGKSQDSESRSMEIKVSKTIKLEHRAGGCKANLQLEYWQKGDVAEVQSVLTNPECAASSGEYTLQVRYRDNDGEVRTDEYPETWSRADAEPIQSKKQYSIGDDVDLVRVRSRGLSCICADEFSSGNNSEEAN